MLIKLFGGALLAVSGFLAGFSMSKSLYRRKAFIKAFIVFIDNLETHIRYSTDDIYKLVSICADCEELECFSHFNSEKIIAFEKLWEKSVITIPKAYALTKNDTELLIQFGSKLGKSDIDGQLKHIKLYKEFFNKQLSDAEDAIINKSRLYKTVGLFAGTAAALVMM